MAGICPRCHNTGTEEYWDDETEQYVERDCTSCVDPYEDESGHDDMWEADMAPHTGLDGPADMVGEDTMNDEFMSEGMEDSLPAGVEPVDEVEEPCEVCGAPFGEKHAVGCPNEVPDEELENDPDRGWDSRMDRAADDEFFGRGGRQFDENDGVMDESADFDKFMDRTLLDEGKRRMVDMPEDNPQRRRAFGHQNRPLDRTRIVRVK